MKSIVIDTLTYSQKTAILEDNVLTELLIEDKGENKTVSNIYRGVVKKVMPGIEAAFIDIGSEKYGYLPLYKNKDIKSGQDILVQINKEEVGTKGAKLTTEISFAGRYIVYIPSNDRITISNKMTNEEERFRLKKIVRKIVGDNDYGIIIRTEAVGATYEELKNDLDNLLDKHNKLLKEYKLGMGPKLLYKVLDKSMKYINDNVNDTFDKIIVNNAQKYEEIKNLLKSIDKELVSKLKLEDGEDVFDLYNVENQIKKALNKKIWLKSGGYLVLERTEALTVVDVNTGKFTGSIELDETVYKTNIEACSEIARQLRLRDIGGIIIIDFIDMEKEEYKKDIIDKLSTELQKEKRKTQVFGMTRLGLVEMVRKRDKEPIDEYYNNSVLHIIDNIEKELIRLNKHTSSKSMEVELSSDIYNFIKSQNTYNLDELGKKYNIKLSIKLNPTLIDKSYKL
jgi:ribonuclease G